MYGGVGLYDIIVCIIHTVQCNVNTTGLLSLHCVGLYRERMRIMWINLAGRDTVGLKVMQLSVICFVAADFVLITSML